MMYTFRISGKRIQEIPLTITLMGIEHHQEPVNRPQGVPFFQWFYCEKGRGEVVINHKRSLISPGQGILIYPNEPHCYYAVQEEWIVSFMGFEGNNCVEILKTLHMHESGVYQFAQKNIFRSYQDTILNLKKMPRRQRERELSVLCYDFLLTLSENVRFLSLSVMTEGNETVQKLISYMEENYDRAISMDDLANEVNLSRGYMQTIFKREMHHTIGKHLNMIRISRAKIMLVQYPERNVADIAQKCGFESPSYFGMLFKRETGKTPDQYRYGPL